MQIIKTNPGSQLSIGRRGEKNARQVRFDLSGWLADFGESGVVELIYQRPGDNAPYPVAVEREGSEVVWTISEVDTANAGTNGKAELRYYMGNALLKSAVSPVTVDKAMGAPAQVPESPGQEWLDQVLLAGAAAKAAADKADWATKCAPYIGTNGNWYVWNADEMVYEDTGCFSGGEAPYIGSNGNWFIGEEDSGVSATGPKGDKGDPGDGATIDATLTKEGQAADAKAVGNAITQLSETIADKLDASALPTAVNDALAQAKASGEFDGADGKTPVKGTDYFTEADKVELVNDVLAALPTWEGGSY